MGEQGIAALAVSKEATLAKHAGRLRYASKLALQVNCPVPGRHTRLPFKIPRFGRRIRPPHRSAPLLGLGREGAAVRTVPSNKFKVQLMVGDFRPKAAMRDRI